MLIIFNIVFNIVATRLLPTPEEIVPLSAGSRGYSE